jgi:Response regulator containing CheY-like receiver, AAA-type ATPase, and DNA-binding domains
MAAATVMIVDDNSDIRNIVGVMLTKAGYHVVEACDGEAAIAWLKNFGQAEDIATIVCDLQMPKINGAEVIAHLRTHHPTVPFVVLTADRDFLLNEILAKQGVCDYLIKPVSKEKLLNAVRVGVRLHGLRVQQSSS